MTSDGTRIFVCGPLHHYETIMPPRVLASGRKPCGGKNEVFATAGPVCGTTCQLGHFKRGIKAGVNPQ